MFQVPVLGASETLTFFGGSVCRTNLSHDKSNQKALHVVRNSFYQITNRAWVIEQKHQLQRQQQDRCESRQRKIPSTRSHAQEGLKLVTCVVLVLAPLRIQAYIYMFTLCHSTPFNYTRSARTKEAKKSRLLTV